MYCDQIHKTPEIACGIAEQPHSASIPILVDIDIKVKRDDVEDEQIKLYTEEQLLFIVQTYQFVLKDTLEELKDHNLTCFIFEKDPYVVKCQNKTEFVKNGFHLHFPFVQLKLEDHLTILIPYVRQIVEESNIFENLGIKNSADVLDQGYVKSPWLLYGSRKDESMQPYVLSRVVDCDLVEIDLVESFAHIKEVEEYPRNWKKVSESKKKLKHYLPRLLSIMPDDKVTKSLRPDSITKIIRKEIDEYQVVRSAEKIYDDQSTKDKMDITKGLIKLISPKRSEDRNDWISIGWTLYTISEGSEEGLELWNEFSRHSEKYDQEVCFDEWKKMKMGKKSLGSLCYLAKSDNEKEYVTYMKQVTKEKIEKNLLNCSHYDLAKLLFAKYGDRFVCAGIKHCMWYEFKTHKWNRIEEGHKLRLLMSDEGKDSILEMLNEQRQEIENKHARADDDDRPRLLKKLDSLRSLIKKLKTTPDKRNILSEAKDLFYDDEFYKKIDSFEHLICFKNGVYDLRNHLLRPGQQSDYISLQMPIEYKQYTYADNAVQEVTKFLEQIFPDRSVRDHFLDITCEVFWGGNKRKKVYFWSGQGDNGKSVTQSLIEKMLGPYAIKLPTSLIVGQRTQSSQACPELARSAGSRWAILQEPDKKDVINVGLLKELSGNDTFYARRLFEEGTEVTPMFKLVVICNDPPSVPYSDKAAWNRIRILPFESTFCDDPPESYEEQLSQKRFPKDPYFNDKLQGMLEPFAWLLIEHFKNPRNSEKDPIKVTLATEAYKGKNDHYKQFFNECLIECPKGTFTVSELYSSFKEWYKEGFPQKGIPARIDFKECMERYIHDAPTNIWKGFRLRTQKDNIAAIEEDENQDEFVGNNNLPPI
jgi:P4 family phage/plasmid primase-like protien